MRRLIIRNIGPIKDVDIELSKINVIMGPQSSGKSTIIKIACFCHWFEKRAGIVEAKTPLPASVSSPLPVISLSLEREIVEKILVRFHKLEDYINEESYFEYESDYVKVSFDKKEPLIGFVLKKHGTYKYSKISYIPAERNLVASIPNWFDVKLGDNNIRNFMADWGTARKSHTKDATLSIPSLSASYYYDSLNDMDYIQIAENKTLKFTNTSSGLQSVTPLVVLMNYFTKRIYEDDVDVSVNELENRTLMGDIQLTNLFVEEPESNLFPLTQRDLLYYMLQSITSEREHSLFLTTHSPYILNALNNCMMGYVVKDEISDEVKQQLLSYSSWISPKTVSVWQIEDGKLIDIKNSRLGTIGEHYFNQNMNDILNEYYAMLKYVKRTGHAE